MLAASASPGSATVIASPPASEAEETTKRRRLMDVLMIWFMVRPPLTSSSVPRRDEWRGGCGRRFCLAGVRHLPKFSRKMVFSAVSKAYLF
jgi:hypothetical protein